MAASQLTSLADAQVLLKELSSKVDAIGHEVDNPSLTREADYLTKVAPKLNDAASQYQTLAAFLQANRNEHSKEYRTVQREFVKEMQTLQQVQRKGTKKREALCDADFIAVSKLSPEDIQIAKEEMLAANQIASEAIEVKQLFQEVGTIIHAQGEGINQIEKKVDSICIEIGRGVNELEQARKLQKEARHKHMVFFCISLLIMTAIALPIVLTFA